MWRWQVIIGFASVGQMVAGLVYFALSVDRVAAALGLVLCAGVAVLSIVSQACCRLVRVTVGANAVLALLTGLGGVVLGIAFVAGVASSWLTGCAIGNAALAAASAGSAVGLWRLSSRTTEHAEQAVASDGGGK
jgi:hypothetical protein